MKTIRLSIITLSIAIFSIGNLTAQEKAGEILTSTEITVKQGHRAQFIDGVKKWKECYLENNGQEKWNMWYRQQGEGNFYIMSGMKANWAELDKEDKSGDACYAVLLNFIMPHIEKTNRRVAQSMPEVSKNSSGAAQNIMVTYYQVKKDYLFEEVITAVSEAIKNKEGSARGDWFKVRFGGLDTPDFFISLPFENYADLDIKRDSPAKIYTDLVGEKKASEMWEKWFETLDKSWSYTYKLESELSN